MVAIAACSDDGEAADADAGGEGGLIDSFLVESSDDANVAPAVQNARLTFVNAAHDLGPQATGNGTVRLCFGTGPSVDSMEVPPLMPTPNVVMDNAATGLPGVDQGRGITLPDIALPLAERVLYPIFILSRAIDNAGASQLTCDRIVGPTRNTFLDLAENVEYWVLPPIAPFTLQPKHAYLLALTGCSGNATTQNPGKCGPEFVITGAGSGNLALRVFEPQADPGAQFVHLSPAANAFFFATGQRSMLQPTLSDVYSGDAGTFLSIAGIDPPLFGLSAIVPAALSNDYYVSLAPNFFPSSLVEVALASGRTDLPYVTGGSYVFAAVGDPDMTETPPETQIPVDAGTVAAPNSRYFHFLGFPSLP